MKVKRVKLMKINFKTKSLEELIGYWIATFRIYCQLMDIVDYSDEVGENYDFEAWLEDDAEEKSLSIMELHGSIEESFTEVCDYSVENEIENFYKVAKNAVKEISEGEY